MSDFYGLIGKTLIHSFSPVIHNLILKNIRKSGEYNLFEVEEEDLDEFLKNLKIHCFKGVNVTIPYKVKIIKYMDDMSREAKNIGAVNTVKFAEDKLIGYNTDYYGFGLTLKQYGIEVLNKNVILLGTGGVSKAVARYILDRGARDMLYVSRNPGGFHKCKFKIISYDELYKVKGGDVIVNCTPCGMYPDVNSCPVDKKILSEFNTAVDLIYNPRNTLFLKWAEECGLTTVNGLYMLVAQAVASQQIWQGTEISSGIVDKIYKEVVGMHESLISRNEGNV